MDTEVYQVECIADAPMRPRAWFPDRAAADAFAARFGADALVTPVPSHDAAVEAARAAHESARRAWAERERELDDALDTARTERAAAEDGMRTLARENARLRAELDGLRAATAAPAVSP